MKLRNLVEEHGANGFVYQDNGNGCAFSEGRFVRIDDECGDEKMSEYGDIELSETLAEPFISADGVKCEYSSEWVVGENGYEFRILF